jgi:hypothetical protein
MNKTKKYPSHGENNVQSCLSSSSWSSGCDDDDDEDDDDNDDYNGGEHLEVALDIKTMDKSIKKLQKRTRHEREERKKKKRRKSNRSRSLKGIPRTHRAKDITRGNSRTLIAKSGTARQMFMALDLESGNFNAQYPDWLKAAVDDDNIMCQMLTSGLGFSCYPFTQVTWEQILSSGVVLNTMDISQVVIAKLVYNAAYKNHIKALTAQQASAITEKDETVQLTLQHVELDKLYCELNFIVPSRDIDVTLSLSDIDAYVLMLLPREIDKERIRLLVECIANESDPD